MSARVLCLALVLGGAISSILGSEGGLSPAIASAQTLMVPPARIVAPTPGPVDATTLNHKPIMGYQGWYRCPADNPNHQWGHWKPARHDVRRCAA